MGGGGVQLRGSSHFLATSSEQQKRLVVERETETETVSADSVPS